MNLWMKPYVADWQQGKNQEELPFYFGLENCKDFLGNIFLLFQQEF